MQPLFNNRFHPNQIAYIDESEERLDEKRNGNPTHRAPPRAPDLFINIIPRESLTAKDNPFEEEKEIKEHQRTCSTADEINRLIPKRGDEISITLNVFPHQNQRNGLFLNFPKEMVSHIFSFLSHRQVALTGTTSKSFHLLSQTEEFQEILLARRFRMNRMKIKKNFQFYKDKFLDEIWEKKRSKRSEGIFIHLTMVIAATIYTFAVMYIAVSIDDVSNKCKINKDNCSLTELLLRKQNWKKDIMMIVMTNFWLLGKFIFSDVHFRPSASPLIARRGWVHIRKTFCLLSFGGIVLGSVFAYNPITAGNAYLAPRLICMASLVLAESTINPHRITNGFNIVAKKIRKLCSRIFKSICH